MNDILSICLCVCHRILEDNVLMERKFNEWEMKAGKQIDADDSNSFVMDDSIRPGKYMLCIHNQCICLACMHTLHCLGQIWVLSL